MQVLIKNFLIVISVLFIGVICSVILNTLLLTHRSDKVRPCKSSDADYIPATEQILDRFQRALRFRTISIKQHVYSADELRQYVNFIHTAYPLLHSSSIVTHEVVANYSLLYTIKGSNSSLKPYMLCSHLDVVPADPKTWDVDPFSGDIKDGFIYGRGTIDVKQGVMGILEATEYLLSKGFKPKRTFYIAFGHDEEVLGEEGAMSISNLLYSRGVTELEFLVDEGLTVTQNMFPGMTVPVALIGVSEKGYINVELKVKGVAGHSSMPLGQTSIGVLAKAITRLEYNRHPSMFGYGPERQMLEHMAPMMTPLYRVIMSNLWLFSLPVSWLFEQKRETNALMRTVTCVTMIQGGVKVNVLPAEVTAKVNHRVHPAQTVAEVVEYDRLLINDDAVEVSVLEGMEPLPISPSGDDDFGYQTVKNSIRQVWPSVAVCPDFSQMSCQNPKLRRQEDVTTTIRPGHGEGKIQKQGKYSDVENVSLILYSG